MPTFKDFTLSTPRPLPVILLLDVSGSMKEHGKIDALNTAVANMINEFAQEDDRRIAIHLGIITFGGKAAQWHQPLKLASEVKWAAMQASGQTPMGAAFALATQTIEDREQISSRAYAPALVLVSDGEPTDDWQSPLTALLNAPRASKAQRLAMAIGDDAT
jgi:uncharacterized protein YegL